MLRVFLASHAHLASGMASSYRLLAGAAENLVTYDAYVEDAPSTAAGGGAVADSASCAQTLAEALDEFYDSVVESGDEVLLLSDVYGGSVNTQMCAYLDHPNTRLVTGINLAFLLEILSVGSQGVTDSQLSEIVEQSRQVLMQVRLDEAPASSSLEDDFF